MGQWKLSPDGVGGYGTSGGSAYYWDDPTGDQNNPSRPVIPPPDIAAVASDPNAGNGGGYSQQYLDYMSAQGLSPAGSAPGKLQTYDPSKGGDFFSQNPSIDTGAGGGLGGFIREHGYMVPLAAMAAFGGAAAMGAGAAEAGGGVVGSTVGTEGAGGLAGGGSFVPAAGSGASFGIDAGATYGSAGLGAGSAGGTALGTGTDAALMGPTYQELGVTGVEGGMAGPTYGELGYNGLNQGAAIDAANSASTIQSIKNGLSTANDVRKAYGAIKNISGLLTSGSGGNAGQLLANGLRQGYGGMTSNPWKYENTPWLPGQTTTSNPVYAKTGLDVSGSGPQNMNMTQSNALMANLLRNG